ncbi:hypothetical protein [Prosthecobacter sp.]
MMVKEMSRHTERLLKAQRVLNPHLQQPITHPRALLLLLSRPAASVVLCDEEATVLEFFGLYWVLEVGGARTGFFTSEDDAVRYLQDQMSVAEEGGKGNE